MSKVERLGDMQFSEEMNRSPDDPIHQNTSYINPSSIGKLFPPELWVEIAFHSTFLATRYGHTDVTICNDTKPKEYLLRHLGSVSKFHRKIVLRYWAYTIHLLEQADLEMLRNLGVTNGIDLMDYVRCLVCRNEYNVYQAPKYAFEGFRLIEELVLYCHWDIHFEGEFSQQQHAHIQADPQVAGVQTVPPNIQENPAGNVHPQPVRMSYQRLKAYFPNTLRTLRVYDSHVPDIYFIQQVAEQCPMLESLTLSRCTVFNREGCEFWRRLPRTESDAYFSNQGISAYAAAIGRELKRIKKLKELYIGIYLTDHAAIDIHLEQHAGLDRLPAANLGVWAKPCEKCVVQYQESTIAAEVEASEILAKEVSTLLTVSWASFCSDKRTGWSIHQIMRDVKGEFQGIS